MSPTIIDVAAALVSYLSYHITSRPTTTTEGEEEDSRVLVITFRSETRFPFFQTKDTIQATTHAHTQTHFIALCTLFRLFCVEGRWSSYRVR